MEIIISIVFIYLIICVILLQSQIANLNHEIRMNEIDINHKITMLESNIEHNKKINEIDIDSLNFRVNLLFKK